MYKNIYNFAFGGGENGTICQSIAGDQSLGCETSPVKHGLTCGSREPFSNVSCHPGGHCWGEHPKKKSINKTINVAFFFSTKNKILEMISISIHASPFNHLSSIHSPTISLLLLPGPPKTKKMPHHPYHKKEQQVTTTKPFPPQKKKNILETPAIRTQEPHFPSPALKVPTCHTTTPAVR